MIRRKPPSASPKESQPPPKARRLDVGGLEGFAEFIGAVMVAALGGSAAIVAALGQFALAIVLALVALGMVLRMWRLRRRRRAAGAGKRV